MVEEPDAYSADEAREDAAALLDHLTELGDLIGLVSGRLEATDAVRDPARDWHLPDPDSALRLSLSMQPDWSSAFDWIEQLASELNQMADSCDEAHRSAMEDAYRGRLLLPDGYSLWKDVPLEHLPRESHYDRMSRAQRFAARNDRDPFVRVVCPRCDQHYRSRDWVGPQCDACLAEEKRP